MPTSTKVTDLKINELTEAQYDTAVQQGIIGENELSVLTDAEAGQVIQVATMPTAAAGELGKIYQFIGTTDANYTNGYFYKCVSDGQDPATYSWSNVQVQASSGGLPSQTGNAGKFLTTDGTDASWSDKPLVNNAQKLTYSIFTTARGGSVIGGNENTLINNAVNNSLSLTTTGALAIDSNITYNSDNPGNYSIGLKGNATGLRALAIGTSTRATGKDGVAINTNKTTQGDYSIAIGANCATNAVRAIQIGSSSTTVTNSDANTFKVANANGNFELMSADGTIPTDRLTKVNSTITLTAAGWSSNTQTVSVTGVSSTLVVFVAPDPADTTDYVSAGILCTSQATNSLTFTATTTPTNDIDVNIVCL